MVSPLSICNYTSTSSNHPLERGRKMPDSPKDVRILVSKYLSESQSKLQMYIYQLSKTTALLLQLTSESNNITPSKNYRSLSGLVQRAHEYPQSLSIDERQNLESAIGTIALENILSGKRTEWVPDFQRISDQLKTVSGQAGVVIQAMNNDKDTQQPSTSYNQGRDEFEDFLEGFVIPAQEKDKIKTDVESAMKKIQKKILNKKLPQKQIEKLRERGDDSHSYDFFRTFLKGKTLYKSIEEWNNEQFNFSETAGLLLDVARKLKVAQGDVLSPEQRDARGRKKCFVNKESDWAQRQTKLGYDLKCGPSASTAHLLYLLDYLNFDDETSRHNHPSLLITDSEIKSIIKAVILYYKETKKKYTGFYHTPIEVVDVYQHYLNLKNKKSE